MKEERGQPSPRQEEGAELRRRQTSPAALSNTPTRLSALLLKRHTAAAPAFAASQSFQWLERRADGAICVPFAGRRNPTSERLMISAERVACVGTFRVSSGYDSSFPWHVGCT